jgi:hypothetical protein
VTLTDYLLTAIALASVGQVFAFVPPTRHAFGGVPISVHFGVPTRQGPESLVDGDGGRCALAVDTAASIGGALKAGIVTKQAIPANAKRIALMLTPNNGRPVLSFTRSI